ncbi:hypothetical protein SHELI_v1c04070 [Spiroplasma helicoides]|uniref:Uncharacterized protein n=1 Tax=Spiroplasma helicoides TaxID=216938 RepID=A0A1B3SKA9_9MOLU|nr:hypothetical protein [Spiroplasma helicoides]AOG60358.1 hypothetical protein SHELI_v1c04070 [Spiroplasma helicoides]
MSNKFLKLNKILLAFSMISTPTAIIANDNNTRNININEITTIKNNSVQNNDFDKDDLSYIINGEVLDIDLSILRDSNLYGDYEVVKYVLIQLLSRTNMVKEDIKVIKHLIAQLKRMPDKFKFTNIPKNYEEVDYSPKKQVVLKIEALDDNSQFEGELELFVRFYCKQKPKFIGDIIKQTNLGYINDNNKESILNELYIKNEESIKKYYDKIDIKVLSEKSAKVVSNDQIIYGEVYLSFNLKISLKDLVSITNLNNLYSNIPSISDVLKWLEKNYSIESKHISIKSPTTGKFIIEPVEINGESKFKDKVELSYTKKTIIDLYKFSAYLGTVKSLDVKNLKNEFLNYWKLKGVLINTNDIVLSDQDIDYSVAEITASNREDNQFTGTAIIRYNFNALYNRNNKSDLVSVGSSGNIRQNKWEFDFSIKFPKNRDLTLKAFKNLKYSVFINSNSSINGDYHQNGNREVVETLVDSSKSTRIFMYDDISGNKAAMSLWEISYEWDSSERDLLKFHSGLYLHAFNYSTFSSQWVEAKSRVTLFSVSFY